jgi:hypothetical protein
VSLAFNALFHPATSTVFKISPAVSGTVPDLENFNSNLKLPIFGLTSFIIRPESFWFLFSIVSFGISTATLAPDTTDGGQRFAMPMFFNSKSVKEINS